MSWSMTARVCLMGGGYVIGTGQLMSGQRKTISTFIPGQRGCIECQPCLHHSDTARTPLPTPAAALTSGLQSLEGPFTLAGASDVFAFSEMR